MPVLHNAAAAGIIGRVIPDVFLISGKQTDFRATHTHTHTHRSLAHAKSVIK